MTRPRQYPHNLTLHQLLESQVARTPQAVAIVAPGRAPVTYNLLLSEVVNVASALKTMEIGRNDCIAVILPDGPEMAVAFLGVAARATCAPLNPAYKSNEFESFFRELRPKALVVETSEDCAAVEVGRRNSIPIVELSRLRANPVATLKNQNALKNSFSDFAGSEDVALILFTSGTTSRPKSVPLTHRNLTASAINIASTLELSQHDRCLNVMPLFHIHALVGGLLGSLAAGASVVCPPGFYAPQFFSWLDEFRPTWYTATPTMHQLILARAREHADTILRSSLRFIRSSSAALPSKVMRELEETFRAPVIQAYGMTEAAYQIASNPLPPRERKPVSVGIAAGPELAIMDETGHFMPTGAVGEVVIRGANVMHGYSNAPEANTAAFANGWFRTGDLGYLDSDGYLFLTGRIKELINRGGEKIAPPEIDHVLMDHPAVLQAVTFAVPHPTLGEDVAAAVVLRAPASVTPRELREFTATRLADFKVPRQIAIVTELPKGSTGKLQRIGLAEKLGITAIEQESDAAATAFEPVQTPLEKKIAAIWSQVLGVRKIGRHDDFLRLGGDSILAAQIIARLSKAFGVKISMIDLAHNVADLAETIEIKKKTRHELRPALHPFSRDRAFPLSKDPNALPPPGRVSGEPHRTYAAPSMEVAVVLEKVCSELLGLERVSINDNFFDLGGHSLLAVKLISRLRDEFQTDLSPRAVCESPTIKELAFRIEDEQKCRLASKKKQNGWQYLVELRPGNVQKPVFFLPGGYGGDFEFLVYARFIHHVGSDYSFYGLKARSADGTSPCQASVEEMAEDYIREIRSVQAEGPYFLIGNCVGGVVAYEIAQQLRAQGEKIALLALMDTDRPTARKYLAYRTTKLLEPVSLWWNDNYYVKRISFHCAQLGKLRWREKLFYLSAKSGAALRDVPKLTTRIRFLDAETIRQESERTRPIKESYIETLRSYRPRPYRGRVIMLVSEKLYQRNPTLGWGNLISDGIEVIKTTGDHETYIRDYVHLAAKLLRACLEKLEVEIAGQQK